jgi:hypothetical protein
MSLALLAKLHNTPVVVAVLEECELIHNPHLAFQLRSVVDPIKCYCPLKNL